MAFCGKDRGVNEAAVWAMPIRHHVSAGGTAGGGCCCGAVLNQCPHSCPYGTTWGGQNLTLLMCPKPQGEGREGGLPWAAGAHPAGNAAGSVVCSAEMRSAVPLYSREGKTPFYLLERGCLVGWSVCVDMQGTSSASLGHDNVELWQQQKQIRKISTEETGDKISLPKLT